MLTDLRTKGRAEPALDWPAMPRLGATWTKTELREYAGFGKETRREWAARKAVTERWGGTKCVLAMLPEELLMKQRELERGADGRQVEPPRPPGVYVTIDGVLLGLMALGSAVCVAILYGLGASASVALERPLKGEDWSRLRLGLEVLLWPAALPVRLLGSLVERTFGRPQRRAPVAPPVVEAPAAKEG